MSKVHLILGDCLDKLKELEDNSVDSIVTDPPYGLSAAPNSGKKSKGGFIGIEREDEYFQIAEARIEYERLNPIKEKKNTDMVNKEIETTLNKFFE